MYSENIEKIKKTLAITRKELSQKIGIPDRTIASYERKERTPSIEFLAQLCKVLNINANWFLTGNGEMFNPQEFEDVKQDILKEVNEILEKYGVKKM